MKPLVALLSMLSVVGWGPSADASHASTGIVSVSSTGGPANRHSFQASITPDARFIVFASAASNLVSGDGNARDDVFLYDSATRFIERVSLTDADGEANNWSDHPTVSNDGRYVAFSSQASNLVSDDPDGDFENIFVRDRGTATTQLVSRSSLGVQAGGYEPIISGDGRFVAFATAATLVPGDTNVCRVGAGPLALCPDVFVHDMATGETIRVSVASDGTQGDGVSDNPAISFDGRYVAFVSYASNLVPGDHNNSCETNLNGLPLENCPDVFVHDTVTGATERVSVSSSGEEGNKASSGLGRPAISADGNYVAFYSHASNLTLGDLNQTQDVFVRDRHNGATIRASNNSPPFIALFDASPPAISADGRYVAYQGAALAPDNDRPFQIYLTDLQRNVTTRISGSPSGDPGNLFSTNASVSADGRVVVFRSWATNLVAGDSNQQPDIFVRDRGIPTCIGGGREEGRLSTRFQHEIEPSSGPAAETVHTISCALADQGA